MTTVIKWENVTLFYCYCNGQNSFENKCTKSILSGKLWSRNCVRDYYGGKWVTLSGTDFSGFFAQTSSGITRDKRYPVGSEGRRTLGEFLSLFHIRKLFSSDNTFSLQPNRSACREEFIAEGKWRSSTNDFNPPNPKRSGISKYDLSVDSLVHSTPEFPKTCRRATMTRKSRGRS